MRLRRYWLGADGRPHVETVTLCAAVPGAPVVPFPGPDVETEGGPLTGPAQVLAIHDPAAGMDALAGQLHQVYEAELPEGVRLLTRQEWDELTATAAAETAAAREAWTTEQTTAAQARRAALGKLAASAGLTEDETAALLGGS